MKTTLLATAMFVGSLGFAAPAFCQDAGAFTGPWVAATAGYDNFDAGTEEDSEAEDGAVYGLAFGYDFNLGGLVVGVEGEVTESSVSATGTDILEEGDELTLSVGRDLYAGLRVGFPVSDKVMLFAKGGYSNQRISATYTLDDETVSESDTVNGFRLGAGVELDLGQPFARLEYRYSDYGSFSDTELETSRHQVTLTAGLRF